MDIIGVPIIVMQRERVGSGRKGEWESSMTDYNQWGEGGRFGTQFMNEFNQLCIGES